jgi:hypothetical protein
MQTQFPSPSLPQTPKPPAPNKPLMHRVMGFIVKKEWAPMALFFSAWVTLSALIVCGVNYASTYNGMFIIGLPWYVAAAFTMLNQGWQVAEPVAELTGAIDKLMPQFKFLLRLFWYATIVVDFVTAFVWFMSLEKISIADVMAFDPRAVSLTAMNALFAFIFLVGEIILYVGLYATKAAYDTLLTEDKPAPKPAPAPAAPIPASGPPHMPTPPPPSQAPASPRWATVEETQQLGPNFNGFAWAIAPDGHPYQAKKVTPHSTQ